MRAQVWIGATGRPKSDREDEKGDRTTDGSEVVSPGAPKRKGGRRHAERKPGKKRTPVVKKDAF